MSAISLELIEDRLVYEKLFARISCSNLLQSWAWGAAKAQAESWVPTRLLLRRGGTSIGLAQVLEKQRAGGRLLRLNRGPLWLDSELDFAIRVAGIAALCQDIRWWRARLGMIAPEFPGTPLARQWLAETGLRPRSSEAWTSSRIDLAESEEVLRKALAGKWRNMLVSAEKADLTVELAEGGKALERLLPLYIDMMRNKGFSGVSPVLLTALSQVAPDSLHGFFASQGGETVSAVLVAGHGSSCTYLIGWNNDAGRRLRGNHLLLWRALLSMRRQGTRWFDLGGIDRVSTPGIAAFKAGLGGDEYGLCGEWIRI